MEEQRTIWLVISLQGIMGDIGVNALWLTCSFWPGRFFRILHVQLKRKQAKNNAHLKETHILVSVHVCASSEDCPPDILSRILCSN